jgi:hypothetical protein
MENTSCEQTRVSKLYSRGSIDERTSIGADPLGDEVAGVFLVGVGLFSLVVALCLCCYLFECITRWFNLTCDWLERRLAKRKVRPRSQAYSRRSQEVASRISAPRSRPPFAPHPSPTAINAAIAKRTTRLAKAPAPVDARDAIRRSCSRR